MMPRGKDDRAEVGAQTRLAAPGRRQWCTLAAVSLLGVLTACGREPAGGSATATEALFGATLPDLDGTAQPLAQWRGQPVLVNFWATWCAPCVKEMPDLDALDREFPDVAFVGIGVDSPENMREFLKKVPVGYTLLEARAQGLDLMRGLGSTTGGLPFTAVIGRDGRIIRAVAGQISPENLRPSLAQAAR